MQIGVIEGANCIMRGNGDDVADLHVVRDGNGFVSAWFPTPAELEALNKGAPVYLFIYGQSHPPVMLGVKKE